jgi:3-oxoacyl-(acyl-carrier-protein) synthase
VTGFSPAPPGLRVTGAAWSTALGSDLDEVWARLVAGRTGDVEVAADRALRSDRVAALPPDAVGGTYAETGRTGGELIDRQSAVTVATGLRALAGAGLGRAGVSAEVLVVLGTSLGAHADAPQDSLYAWARETARLLGSGREPVALSTACSSGSDAIATAAALIRAGVAERCLVGAVDLVTPGKRYGHSRLGTMSCAEPRSFDQDRDGMMLGEACGFLVLESARAAAKRSAPCLGLLTGWGASNDACGPTAPDATGASAALALRQALDRAARTPADVAVVSTHGTGTTLNDEAEAAALARVWPPDPADGPSRRPVAFATKGALGHSLGATGVVEAITVLLALRHRKVPPVPHLKRVMDGFPLPLPVADALPIGSGCGVSQTLGFGGFNTCLLFESAPAGEEIGS